MDKTVDLTTGMHFSQVSYFERKNTRSNLRAKLNCARNKQIPLHSFRRRFPPPNGDKKAFCLPYMTSAQKGRGGKKFDMFADNQFSVFHPVVRKVLKMKLWKLPPVALGSR